jgi:putative addiction module component (TIGR02574 family)
MQLPESARIELAEPILDSVSSKSPAEVEASWSAEIRRRCDELDQGAETVSWSEVRDKLRSSLKT